METNVETLYERISEIQYKIADTFVVKRISETAAEDSTYDLVQHLQFGTQP